MADPLQAKRSTDAHEVFPHVWAKATPVADGKCGGCPVAALHPSCTSVVLRHDGAEEEIQNAADLARWQWQLQRLALISSGVPGAYNGSYTDGWKPYNAAGSLNFADASSWDVIGVSGRNVTLELQGGGDPRSVALYVFRVTDPMLGLPAGFGLRTGCLQPGDIIQFSENSVISNSCWPLIVRIVSYDVPNSRVVVECDKEPTAALTKFQIDDGAGGWMPDPNPVTCRVWQHAGNEAKWRKIIRPDYFFGQRKRLAIDAAALPEDGIVEIEADAAVMHPGGFDPLRPTWTLEGQRLDDSTWESVPNPNQRLFVLPEGPSRVALKDEVPEESHVELSGDLTETYGRFRMVYYKRVEATANGCELVGYGRCRWSVPDYTDSAPGGEAGCQPGWTCLKRAIDINTVSDEWDRTVVPAVPGQDGIMDTTTHSYGQATGAVRYPEDGQCLQHGMCDEFEGAEGHGDGTPYSVPHHAGNVLREMWGACDMRLQRIRTMDSSFSAWQAQRVAHASIAYLLGYINLSTFPSMERISNWRGNGVWGLDWYTWTDDDDNEYLELQPGAFEGWRHDDPTEDFEGDIPAGVAGFENARNPIDPDTPTTMLEMERIGVLVEKDSGDLQTRGISRSSVAVAAQDIVVPNIDTGETGTQTRGVAEFEWDGVGDAVVRLMPLRQEAKAAGSLGSRVVHSVQNRGGGVVRITFENVQHSWSYIDTTGGLGSAYDRIFNWWGGGGWPIMPPPKQQIDSWHEPHKYTGGRNGGAWPGDSVAHGDRRFVITAVAPYGADPAGNWGSTRVENLRLVGSGMFVPSEPNVGDGAVAYTSIRDSMSNDFEILANDDRPAIGAGQCWLDGAEVYFSAADDGQWAELKYDVFDRAGTLVGDFTEYFTIQARRTVSPNFPAATWTDADTREMLADGVPMTAAGSAGAVAAGQYHVDTSGSEIQLTTHIAQAGVKLEAVLTWDEEAPAPGDHFCLGGNLQSFGKRRDYIDVYDDADGYLMTLAQGNTLDFETCAAVMLPGATLEWTQYGTDNWQAVSGAEVRHGTGEFVIPAAWFDGKPQVVCFRLVDVRWMDHRGIVSGAVWEKTRTVMEALTQRGWVWTGWDSPIVGGVSEYGESHQRGRSYDRDWDNCGGWFLDEEIDVKFPLGSAPPYNVINKQISGKLTQGAVSDAFVYIRNGASVGFPAAFKLLPKGSVILSAYAELNCSNLVTSFTQYDDGNDLVDCDDIVLAEGFPNISESIPTESLTWSVVGFTSRDSYEEIGSVSGVSTHTVVRDVTAVVQKMYSEVDTGKYAYGFALLIKPPGFGVAEAPAIEENWISYCTNFGPCPDNRVNWMPVQREWEVRWGSAYFGKIFLQIKLPDEDRERMIIMDRWPARHEIST